MPYKFPKIELSTNEQQWLGTICQQFLKGYLVDVDRLKKSWYEQGKWPKGFRPSEIDSRLLQEGNKPTLLGIWHAYPVPDNKWIEKFDQLIRYVKERISNSTSTEIKVAEIAKAIGIPEHSVSVLIHLLTSMGFYYTATFAPIRHDIVRIPDELEMYASLRLDDPEKMDEYLSYENMEEQIKKVFGESQAQLATMDAAPPVEMSELTNPPLAPPPASERVGDDIQSPHLAHANELYNKVKDLIQNVGTLDETTARLIVELADDAIKDFGNTNQEKKVELRRIREEAEEALPPKTIEELRKRAEGKTLKRTYPKTKTGRLLVAIIIIVVTALGILYGWYSAIKPSPDKQALTSSTPQSQSKSEATTELALRYYLTIQKTEDDHDIGHPFNSSGREGLGSGWKFRLNFSSPQQGFLYLLYENLESQKPEFILLFPTIVEASTQLSANEKYSLPASNNVWYFITGDSTKDRVWVIWSAKTLPELDAIKGRAAKLENLGEINEPFDVYPILRLIENAAKTPPELDSDTRVGITSLRVKGDLLLFPIDITHTK